MHSHRNANTRTPIRIRLVTYKSPAKDAPTSNSRQEETAVSYRRRRAAAIHASAMPLIPETNARGLSIIG
jgi:hypothetical protein